MYLGAFFSRPSRRLFQHYLAFLKGFFQPFVKAFIRAIFSSCSSRQLTQRFLAFIKAFFSVVRLGVYYSHF